MRKGEKRKWRKKEIWA